MKTSNFVLAFSILIFITGCSENNLSNTAKSKALQDYNICKQIADEWFIKLDSSNYKNLLSVKFGGRDNRNSKESILSFINEVQKEYGKINSRTFIGAHIWSGKKLLTYAPRMEDRYLNYIKMQRSEDGFYKVNPRFLGLSSAGEMFSGFPKGEYVVLMYRSLPANKSYAEEALTLWHNPQGSWQVFTYKISDDI